MLLSFVAVFPNGIYRFQFFFFSFVMHSMLFLVSFLDALLRFIEGDFDTYVERIQRPYVWGGEPELLMASHVLK